MVQLNLLPDVKLEYIKTKRMKRIVMTGSILAISLSLGIFIAMLIFVSVVQDKHITNLDQDIDEDVATIQNTSEVNEILTVQNQLAVLNGKHDEKPAAIRILPFVAQTLPTGSKITDLEVNFTTGTIVISGIATDINSTNKFVDTLKFATYKTGSGVEGKPFSEVVLSSYTTDPGDAQFTVNAKFDPVIFDNSDTVNLSIPGIVSTRSSTEKPEIQFDEQTQPVSEEDRQNAQ